MRRIGLVLALSLALALYDRDGALAHERDGNGMERTPWRAVQVAGWQALRNASAEEEGGR